jgi:hypothetical protein
MSQNTFECLKCREVFVDWKGQWVNCTKFDDKCALNKPVNTDTNTNNAWVTVIDITDRIKQNLR